MKRSLPDGEHILSIGERGSDELEFDWPMGICYTKDELLIIGDRYNKRVQVLRSDDSGLTFVRMMSCQSNVRGVSVDSSGNIHAAAGDRIEVFSISGEKLTEYGEGVLHTASDVAFLNNCLSSQYEFSFVTDRIDDDTGRVCVFDWHANNLLHSFSAGGRPDGIAIDQEGTIFICVKQNCIYKV